MKAPPLAAYPVALLSVAAGLTAQSQPFVLSDPPLVSGAGAIDPQDGPFRGRQNITHVAEGAPSPAELAALPGFAVLQSFLGFEGGMKSQTNRVEFSDGRPSIAFSINQSTGYGGCHSGPGEKTATTSGTEPPKMGDSIYIGAEVNDLAYTISFSTPVSAAGFALCRTLPTPTGAEAIWTVSYYGAGSTVQSRTLLARQSVTPGRGANVAAYFAYIAQPGTAISRIVVGKDERATPFVMGKENIFLDDLAFVPSGAVPSVAAAPAPMPVVSAGPFPVQRPIQPDAGSLAPPGGTASRPRTGRELGAPGGESIDIQGSNASPQSFLQQLSDIRVVQDWNGFQGGGRTDREVINLLEFDDAPDFRFRLQLQNEGSEGSGGMTNEGAWASSPGQALRIGGSGGAVRLEILAGTSDPSSRRFSPDQTVHAAGFVITNAAVGEVVVTFYNLGGEVLALQSAYGTQDPANAGQPLRNRGAEMYFGHIAYAPNDPAQRIHRIRIDAKGDHPWGLDDFAFATRP